VDQRNVSIQKARTRGIGLGQRMLIGVWGCIPVQEGGRADTILNVTVGTKWGRTLTLASCEPMAAGLSAVYMIELRLRNGANCKLAAMTTKARCM
jgi:hypothetical protein